MIKYVFDIFSKLGIKFAVCINWIDDICWKNLLMLVPSCCEVVVMVAKSGRYSFTIVMSYTEINKTVSQWLLTCTFHKLCAHTPEIIDLYRGVCDNELNLWDLLTNMHVCMYQGTCAITDSSDDVLHVRRQIATLTNGDVSLTELLTPPSVKYWSNFNLFSWGKLFPYCACFNTLRPNVGHICVS